MLISNDDQAVDIFTRIPAGETYKEVCCIGCGQSHENFRRLVFERPGYQYHRCRRCGIIYQVMQPVFSDMRKRYDDYLEYEIENSHNFFDLMMLGLDDIGFFNRSKGKFLDVGCATGILIQFLSLWGWRVWGVEISLAMVEYAKKRRRMDVNWGTLSEAGFDSDFFDVVYLHHVIEHVPDPRKLLEEVKRVLCPGGSVIIITPNTASLQRRIFGSTWRSVTPDHMTLFSKKTLRRMLEDVGFGIKNFVVWGGLAKERSFLFLKKPLDWLAKKWKFGDVMLYEGVRNG